MRKLTRGNLLATLKELKKHKRPNPVVSSVTVQAICPQKSLPKKSMDMQAVLERRKILHSRLVGSVPNVSSEELVKFDNEFEEFMLEYNSQKCV